MRVYMIFLSLALGTNLFIVTGGCSNSTSKHTSAGPDTTYPVVIYQVQNTLQYGVWRRVKVDSLTFVDKDSTTKIKQWARVPIYFIPIQDSTTKKIVYYRVDPVVKVWDMNIDTDSLTKIYVPVVKE